jgi:hypothetical protein
MPDAPDRRLLEAPLDSWNRNNTILLNLLHALPEGGLDARAMESSSSIAELFTHIHSVRTYIRLRGRPRVARQPPEKEWRVERDCDRMAQMLQGRARRGEEHGGSRLRQVGLEIWRDQATSTVRHCVSVSLLPCKAAIFEVECNNAESRTSHP